MKRNELVAFIAIFAVVIIGALSMKATPVEAQRAIPIRRYEFPQDGVVCYISTSSDHTSPPISCVKVQ